MAARTGNSSGAGTGDRSNNGNENNRSKNYLSPAVPSMLEKSPSLQRLHNQSSTETSGLGETVTSGFSSQESIASFRSGKSGKSGKDLGLGGREHARDITEERCGNKGSGIAQPMKDTCEKVPPAGHAKKHIDGQTVQFQPKRDPATSSAVQVRREDSTDGTGAYDAGPDFDELFTQSKNHPVPQQQMGLQVEQIEIEWNRRSRNSSIKSRSSHGSFRSRSGSNRGSRKFLGRNTESRWMKWSKERRASYRRRLELLDKPDPDIPERASTPVKKARQEGLMFIHPDLKRKYISEEDIHYIQRHRQQRMQTYKVIEKNKKNKIRFPNQHDMQRLNVYELNVLTRFWEHRMFIRSRYVSILFSIVTTLMLTVSISSSHWIIYPSTEIKSRNAHEGLWKVCTPVLHNTSIEENCRDQTGRHWQKAVIGLMIFAAAFGFVAAVLAVLGVCTSPLPKKIYYFHSAGEIFFVCALSTSVALVIYPIEMNNSFSSYSFGSGYGLGWGGTGFLFAASFCMSLDDLVRCISTNKCCKWCWKSRTTDRTELQQV